MRAFYLVLVAGIFTLAACKNKTPKTADQILEQAGKNPALNAGAGKYSFNTPEGWKRMDTTMQNIKFTYLFAPVDAKATFHPNINIGSEDMRGTSLDDYFEKNVKQMAQFMQNFNAGTASERTNNGNKVKIQEYSHTMGGMDMDVSMAVIPVNGIAYIVTITAEKGHRADYQKEFDQVVNSFSVSE